MYFFLRSHPRLLPVTLILRTHICSFPIMYSLSMKYWTGLEGKQIKTCFCFFVCLFVLPLRVLRGAQGVLPA